MTQAADVAAVGNEKCYAVDGPGEYGWCKASHFFYHNTKREALESVMSDVIKIRLYPSLF